MLKALLDSPSSFNVSILSRKSSTSTFPSDVKVISISDHYPHAELVKAFSGQDAVVSTIASLSSAKQVDLINAAIEAKVQRFIPAEFGSDTHGDSENLKSVTIFQEKAKATERLRKAQDEGLTWTEIINGPFLDWGLKVGFLGLNLAEKSARLGDEGDHKFSTSSLPQIGLGVARVLERADKTANQVLYIQSAVVSQNSLLKAAEKITGQNWKVDKIDLKKFVAENAPKSAAGDIGANYEVIFAHIVGGEDEIFSERKTGYGNEVLGLEQENVEPYVEKWIKG